MNVDSTSLNKYTAGRNDDDRGRALDLAGLRLLRWHLACLPRQRILHASRTAPDIVLI